MCSEEQRIDIKKCIVCGKPYISTKIKIRTIKFIYLPNRHPKAKTCSLRCSHNRPGGIKQCK